MVEVLSDIISIQLPEKGGVWRLSSATWVMIQSCLYHEIAVKTLDTKAQVSFRLLCVLSQ